LKYHATDQSPIPETAEELEELRAAGEERIGEPHITPLAVPAQLHTPLIWPVSRTSSGSSRSS
jgi:hypothetical protein